MNKPKRSLRSTLADLAAAFADAVIAAARESILELGPEKPRRPRAEPARAERGRSASAERTKAVRVPLRPTRAKPSRRASDHPGSPAGDLLITDPQALLTALETADPSGGWDSPAEVSPPRAEPEILRPVSRAAAPVSSEGSASLPASPAASYSTFAPVLREGEVIVRRSAGGIVLRRRRA